MMKDDVPKWDSEENTAPVREMVALTKKGCGCKTGFQTSRCKCKRGGNLEQQVPDHILQESMMEDALDAAIDEVPRGTCTVVLFRERPHDDLCYATVAGDTTTYDVPRRSSPGFNVHAQKTAAPAGSEFLRTSSTSHNKTKQ